MHYTILSDMLLSCFNDDLVPCMCIGTVCMLVCMCVYVCICVCVYMLVCMSKGVGLPNIYFSNQVVLSSDIFVCSHLTKTFPQVDCSHSGARYVSPTYCAWRGDMCMCIYICLCMCVCAYMPVHVCVCIYACACVCVNICLCMCVYAYMPVLHVLICLCV